MPLTSDWQDYVPPKYRVSQFAAHLVYVELSFYMTAPHGGSRNKKATRYAFAKKCGHCSIYWRSQNCFRILYLAQVSAIWGKLRRMYRTYIWINKLRQVIIILFQIFFSKSGFVSSHLPIVEWQRVTSVSKDLGAFIFRFTQSRL